MLDHTRVLYGGPNNGFVLKDRTEGDIDQLTQRIAHVRTWSYIANRADWVQDPGHWQARAQLIEDRLQTRL